MSYRGILSQQMLIIILCHRDIMYPRNYIFRPNTAVSFDFRGFEGSPADAESSGEDDTSKNIDKPKIPRKRFPWTDEAKYVTG